MTEAFSEVRESMRFVSFESGPGLRGIELLKPLLSAITSRRVVTFTHESYATGKRKRFSVRPHLLKEYLRRWYLVATIPGIPNQLFFGVDRIEDLRVTTRTFHPEALSLQGLRDVVGLTRPPGAATEEIVLSFDRVSGQYVKSLPLHESQRVLRESARRTVVAIRVVPNYELLQQLLMYGEGVRVLSPPHLARELEAVHRACLKGLRAR
jgi:predicted DNA-binding transcriptional regulator YafY